MKLTHVPYRNIAQYGPDLIAGQVPLGFQWYPNVAGPIGAKGAIPLAVAGDKRIAALPDTPTTTEARHAAIQGSTAGSRCWRRPARRNRSWKSSTRK